MFQLISIIHHLTLGIEWCFTVETQDKWESGTDDSVHLAFKFSDGSECITDRLYDPAINNFCGPPACPGGYRHTYCGHFMPPNPKRFRYGWCSFLSCSTYPPFCGTK